MDSLAQYLRKSQAGICLALGAVFLIAEPASAGRISNPVAEFNGLDKITGRITSFDVYIGETVQFGALQVTPRVCYTRDETEAQRVDAFVEVEEITLDRKIRRIFNGWMFADSPGLNAVEHPIYDVWLKACKLKSDVPPPEGLALPDSTPQDVPEPEKQPESAGSDNSQQENTDGATNADGAAEQNADSADTFGGTQPLQDQLPEDAQPQQPEVDVPPALKNLKPGTGLF